MTEIENVRSRNRSSGTIGSAARDSIQRKTRRRTRPSSDQAADGRVGPLAPVLLVRQADEERRDRRGEHGRPEVVDVPARRPAA